MTEMVQTSDYEVVIDGQSYSVSAVPAADSGVVIAERDRLLKDLQLDSLSSNQLRAGELLALAYNATRFGELRGAATVMSHRLTVLTSNCESTLQQIGRSSSGALANLGIVSKFLANGREEVAVTWLGKVSAAAKDMADQAGKLPDQFETLSNDAAQLLAEVQKVRGETEELVNKKEELQQALQLNARFWRQMSDYCRDLAGCNLAGKIETYETFEDRATRYQDAGFKEEFVRFMAGFKAIEVIAESALYSSVRSSLNKLFLRPEGE